MPVVFLSVLLEIYQAIYEGELTSARLEVLREIMRRHERENSIEVESWVVSEPKQIEFPPCGHRKVRAGLACLEGRRSVRPGRMFPGWTPISSPAGRQLST